MTPRDLLAHYRAMEAHFGHTGWWPADTRFEIAVGAILTQNTAWTNVEKALVNLKRAKMLSAKRIAEASIASIIDAIRPAGYYNQKSIRVQGFARHLIEHYGGSMTRMAKRPLDGLRPELLAMHGIGPETADDILLYACEKPVFVIDAYTRRIMSRHGHVNSRIGYEEMRAYFESRLPADLALFKEFHAVLDYTAKHFCTKRAAKCEGCPLQPFLPEGGPRMDGG